MRTVLLSLAYVENFSGFLLQDKQNASSKNLICLCSYVHSTKVVQKFDVAKSNFKNKKFGQNLYLVKKVRNFAAL